MNLIVASLLFISLSKVKIIPNNSSSRSENQGTLQSSFPSQVALEFPKNMAFSIIKKMAKDITRSGISFISDNNELILALNKRWKQLNLDYHLKMFTLRYLYYGQSVIGINPILTDEALSRIKDDKGNYQIGSGIQPSDIEYLYKIKEYSRLPQMSGSWEIQFYPASQVGFLENNELYLMLNSKPVPFGFYILKYDLGGSLYKEIFDVCDAMDNSVQGIGTALKNFGTPIKKDSVLDQFGSATAFAMSQEASYAALGSNQRDMIVNDTKTELTNWGINASGLLDSHEVIKDLVAVMLSRTKSSCFGSAMGTLSSSESDNRLDASSLESWHSDICDDAIKKLMINILNEKKGIIGDLKLTREDIESVTYKVNPFYPQTEKEDLQTKTREYELIRKGNQDFNIKPQMFPMSEFWKTAFINQEKELQENSIYRKEMADWKSAKQLGVQKGAEESGESISGADDDESQEVRLEEREEGESIDKEEDSI